jgi:hypothetical protein
MEPKKEWYFQEAPGFFVYPRAFITKDPNDKEFVVGCENLKKQKEIQDRIDSEGIAWLFK